MTEALLQNALRKHQNGDLEGAARLYREVLHTDRRNFRALYLLGFVYFQNGKFADAERLIGEALLVNPHAPDAWYNRGCALQSIGRLEDAVACFDKAVGLNARYDNALINRGAALLALNRHDDALASVDAALALKPNDVEALSGRTSALLALGRNGEALAAAERALAVAPDRAATWNSRGAALAQMKRHDEALLSYERAIALDPGFALARINRGLALLDSQRTDEALRSYDADVAAMPQNADLRAARADALQRARAYEDAAREYETVLRLDPDRPYARGNLAFCRLHVCDWRSLKDDRTTIASGLNAGTRIINPFQAFALSASRGHQLACARIAAADRYSVSGQALWRGERYKHERIRLAYLSADFNDHAVATLMAGVFEHHDKTRFETIAISLTQAATSKRRRRLEQAFDRFVETGDKDDLAAARWLREMEVDIAVDLMGYTGECRPKILAFRPAPIQVNYLGFPGTMGPGAIDVLIADATVIPDEDRGDYGETVVHLPDTYLPADDKRPIAPHTPTHAEAGLPDDGFVFCSFNNTYKFTPEIFDVWMRLLDEVETSVLWLPATSEAAMRNLRREAEARCIDAQRLIFAPFLASADEHLARLKLADLFLDTLPYNAHSTASDALWAGLPVLTTPGETFAGRVAASLLKAVGLPEMIADSLPAYEQMALRLATDPAALRSIREKLARNRTTSPAFDTARFTRNLEAVLLSIHERRSD
jgi:predicted O-linked N-acetylglucosamine transferase (SPINDLY family)